MAAAQHHGIHFSICPVAGELFKILVQHIVQRVVRRIHFVDVAGKIQLLHKFAV
ncbi:hypothetical protein ASD8599_04021 [Ascidiaceihabitans donghaensis]|uniref:Uncharacterized protein n=1 Tax=Ascidiaceihabitans donghaensis TaxID=1510460 RepID=A0A2R8BPQ6_9RHOB|nr:hypothetical protein ASD8599_04021 [Ascidiaceihabitans donghaensis]